MRYRFGTMDSSVLLVLCLLCGLEVNSQTFPNLTFGNDIGIPNHGYVDLDLVGTSYLSSVQCHTDLSTCCASEESNHRGQWYFPDDKPVSQGNVTDFYQKNRSNAIDLCRRNDATSPTGIYRCEIPTTTVNEGESVYVGLYTSEGKCIS